MVCRALYFDLRPRMVKKWEATENAVVMDCTGSLGHEGMGGRKLFRVCRNIVQRANLHLATGSLR